VGSQRCPIPAIRYSRAEFPTEEPDLEDLVVTDSGEFGTNAMQIYEPRQIRKEAAVNRNLHVPLAILKSSLQ